MQLMPRLCRGIDGVLTHAGPASGGSREQFSTRAQAMSVRMQQMANRIGELTRMARQTSMFEDNSAQINQLTAQVKTGLQSMVCASSPPCPIAETATA